MLHNIHDIILQWSMYITSKLINIHVLREHANFFWSRVLQRSACQPSVAQTPSVKIPCVPLILILLFVISLFSFFRACCYYHRGGLHIHLPSAGHWILKHILTPLESQQIPCPVSQKKDQRDELSFMNTYLLIWPTKVSQTYFTSSWYNSYNSNRIHV